MTSPGVTVNVASGISSGPTAEAGFGSVYAFTMIGAMGFSVDSTPLTTVCWPLSVVRFCEAW